MLLELRLLRLLELRLRSLVNVQVLEQIIVLSRLLGDIRLLDLRLGKHERRLGLGLSLLSSLSSGSAIQKVEQTLILGGSSLCCSVFRLGFLQQVDQVLAWGLLLHRLASTGDSSIRLSRWLHRSCFIISTLSLLLALFLFFLITVLI